MSITVPQLDDLVVYPDSDGQPMAENTLQYEWIVRIKGNLDAVFRDRPDVFVAGDNLIYPVKGRNDIRTAPDVYVAFDRPKGHRGSYQVWKEGDHFPQVVFEVLSPGNRAGEMAIKFEFYRKHGAEEYYIYDPDRNILKGYQRQGDRLISIRQMHDWISPLLNIRFDMSGPELELYRPDGTTFFTFDELDRARIASELKAASAGEQLEVERERTEAEERRAQAEKLRADAEERRAQAERLRAETEERRADAEKLRAEAEERRAEAEKQRADSEKLRAEIEQQRAEQEAQRAEAEKQRANDAEARAAQLAAKLRELGIDPTL